MVVTVRDAGADAIAEYARVPIAFEVTRVFDCREDDTAPARVSLSQRALDNPYIKDYDAIAGEHPTQWPMRFADRRWTLLLAYADGAHVGGTVVVSSEESEHATIWDIRVAPLLRRAGVGSALFRRAEEWARQQACRALEVETQSVNVPACRFYERQGCLLHAANRSAYSAFPDELQLIWRKSL